MCRKYDITLVDTPGLVTRGHYSVNSRPAGQAGQLDVIVDLGQ